MKTSIRIIRSPNAIDFNLTTILTIILFNLIFIIYNLNETTLYNLTSLYFYSYILFYYIGRGVDNSLCISGQQVTIK